MTIVAQKYFAWLLYPSWTVLKVGFTVAFKSTNPTTFQDLISCFERHIYTGEASLPTKETCSCKSSLP